MGLLLRLEAVFSDRKAFPRHRKKPRVKALAVRLYHEGLQAWASMNGWSFPKGC